jgi:hypothetical protein
LEFFDINLASLANVEEQKHIKVMKKIFELIDGISQTKNIFFKSFVKHANEKDENFDISSLFPFVNFNGKFILSRRFLWKFVSEQIEKQTDIKNFPNLKQFFHSIYEVKIIALDTEIEEKCKIRDILDFIDSNFFLFFFSFFQQCEFFINKLESIKNDEKFEMKDTEEFEVIIFYLVSCFLKPDQFESSLFTRVLFFLSENNEERNEQNFFTKLVDQNESQFFIIKKRRKILENLDKILSFWFSCYQQVSEQLDIFVKSFNSSIFLQPKERFFIKLVLLKSITSIVLSKYFPSSI